MAGVVQRRHPVERFQASSLLALDWSWVSLLRMLRGGVVFTMLLRRFLQLGLPHSASSASG